MSELYPVPQLLSMLPKSFRPWVINRTRKYTNPLAWRWAIAQAKFHCFFVNTFYLDKCLRTARIALRNTPQSFQARVIDLETSQKRARIEAQQKIDVAMERGEVGLEQGKPTCIRTPVAKVRQSPGTPAESRFTAWIAHARAMVAQGKVSASRVPAWALG